MTNFITKDHKKIPMNNSKSLSSKDLQVKELNSLLNISNPDQKEVDRIVELKELKHKAKSKAFEEARKMPSERVRVEFRQPELTKNAEGFIRSGEYMGGKAYADYESVIINGKTFDSKTVYSWDDPDFPDQEQFEEALEKAKKENPNKPSPADFLDYSESVYTFKLDGIRITEDGDAEGFPKDTPLGRIDLKSLEVVS